MATKLKDLNTFVGSWTTEATHPAMPGVVVKGTASFEWLEGETFLISRARQEDPKFPSSISVIGFNDEDRVGDDGTAHPDADSKLTMQYFDSRGVFRIYQCEVDSESIRFERLADGLSQRFRGVFTDGGATIEGLWKMCEDGTTWKDDLAITYRRVTK